jgi:hypothetical protein
MGAAFENLTEEELCALMCGGLEDELEDVEMSEIRTQRSMSDPVSKVEIALKNSVNDMKLIAIKDCKYLLPCGKCDKTDLLCSQYER